MGRRSRTARLGPEHGHGPAARRFVAARDGPVRVVPRRRGNHARLAVERPLVPLVARGHGRPLALLDARTRSGPAAQLWTPLLGAVRRRESARGAGPVRLHRPGPVQRLDGGRCRGQSQSRVSGRVLLARPRRAAEDRPGPASGCRVPEEVVPVQRQNGGRRPACPAGYRRAEEALRRKQLLPGRPVQLPQVAVLCLCGPGRRRAGLSRSAAGGARGTAASAGTVCPCVLRSGRESPRRGRPLGQQQHADQPHAGAQLFRRPAARSSAVCVLDEVDSGLCPIQVRDRDGRGRSQPGMPQLRLVQPLSDAEHLAEHPPQPGLS